jgi:hypothetical protein
VDGDRRRSGHERPDRLEVAQRVVGKLGEHVAVEHRLRDGGERERVAVRGDCARARPLADLTTGAWTVLDKYGLTEIGSQPVRDQPGDKSGALPGAPPTMILIVRLGQSTASANVATNVSRKKPSTANGSRSLPTPLSLRTTHVNNLIPPIGSRK